MIIGVCGYGYTGSGAVIDLLREYNGLQVCDDLEFDFLYAPGGINDLSFHLCKCPIRYLSGNTAIKRFIQLIDSWSSPNSLYMKATKGKFKSISMDYVDSLIQCRYKGLDNYDIVFSSMLKRNLKYRLGMRIKWILGSFGDRFAQNYLYTDMYVAIEPEDFLLKSKNYLRRIIESLGYHNIEKLVLNQPYPAENPEIFFEYYDEPYAIIVDRDPRDLFILSREVLKMDGSFIPTDTVENFILFYKKTHHNRDNERVINLRFEDLIYNYEQTVFKLENKLKLETHTCKKKYFNPYISINNTQLFKKYKKYEVEIKIIEKELSEFLYPFEDHQEIHHNRNAF